MRDLETWARRYLPLTGSPPSVLRRVLYGYREILAAAGLLEIGSCPGSCVIIADLVTPGTAPDPGAAQRQAALSRAALWHTP